MAQGDQVQKIKERLSILDVVAPYVELHKAGKSFKGKSPFTNEKTPSFYVSPDRGMYYCFSSNQGGDIFTFIEKMEGVDFKGALKMLAEKAGVELVREDPKKRTERETAYALIEEACKFYFDEGVKDKAAQDYILDRGVDGKSIHVWRIGFAPDAWRSLKDHLSRKGFSEAMMLGAGLIKKSDEAKESYDVFRNRIMFPIADSSGRIVAFSGRTLSSDSETPKYVNSPETALYQKSEILFGYDKAKQGIRSLDFSLIVEGQFDLVLAHQAGYTNTVAVSGTALTEHHVRLLQRLSNRVVLALDSDRAGIAAVQRAAALMLRLGMDVKVVAIEEGKDPADIIKEDPKVFRHMVGEAKHAVEFLLGIFKKNAKDERTYKLMVRDHVLPLLAHMPNRIDREHFEGLVAESLDTTKDGIHFEVERIIETENPDQPEPRYIETTEEGKKHEDIKEARVRYLFAARDFLRSQPSYVKVAERIEQKLEEICGAEFKEVTAHMTPEVLNPELSFIEQSYEESLGKYFFEDIAHRLSKYHEDVIRRQIVAKRKELHELERNAETVGMESTLAEIGELTRQLTDVLVTADDLHGETDSSS